MLSSNPSTNIGLIIGVVAGVVGFLFIPCLILIVAIIMINSHARMKENKSRMNEYIAEMEFKDKLNQVNCQGICLHCIFLYNTTNYMIHFC